MLLGSRDTVTIAVSVVEEPELARVLSIPPTVLAIMTAMSRRTTARAM